MSTQPFPFGLIYCCLTPVLCRCNSTDFVVVVVVVKGEVERNQELPSELFPSCTREEEQKENPDVLTLSKKFFIN